MFTQPLRIEMQHLVAPRHIGQGIAGMHAACRHQHQAAWRQAHCRLAAARKHAATRIDGTDRKRRMAVRFVAGPTVAGASGFDVGQSWVAVKINQKD